MIDNKLCNLCLILLLKLDMRKIQRRNGVIYEFFIFIPIGQH